MKKHIIILAAFFAAALLVPGCNPEYTPGLGSQELKISLFCDEPETKADPEPDPFAFEKAIDHFDFFFFKDAEGTQPIRGMHGRVTGSEKVLDTSEGGEFEALRKGTSYVYILANYPGTINHSSNYTLAQLLALEVDAPIVTAKETKRNPITGDMEETGKVTYCNNLVMDSYQKATSSTPETYTTKLTPQAVEEERTVTVKLSRLASKLDLTIKVKASVPGSMTYTDAGGTEHHEVWRPVLNDLHAYFVNALNNKSTVSADPIQRSEIEDEDVDEYEYLTYPTLYALSADASDDHKFTSAPAYTYPQIWDADANGEPYFKIQIPWESSLRGSSTFYYKIALPKSESNKRTINRNMHYQVTVDLSVVDTENEYVELNGSYVVTPWLASGWDGGNDVKPAKFFSVPVNEFEVFSQENVSAPFYSSSATKAYFTEISFYYYGAGAGSQYKYTYTEADNKTSVTLHTSSSTSVPKAARDLNNYSLVRDGNSWKLTHSVSNIYTVRTIKFVIKNEDGRQETVTVLQHPAIEFETFPTRNFFVNGHFSRATPGVHVPGNSAIKLGVPWSPVNAESDQLRYRSDDTNFPNVPAYNNLNGGYYWWPGSTDGWSGTGHWGLSPRVQSDPDYGRYGYIVADAYVGIPYLVKLTVSAFNNTNNTYTIKDDGTITDPKTFVLGDPRVEGGETRFAILSTVPNKATNTKGGGYLYQSSTVRTGSEATTGTAVYKGWKNPEKIMISSPDPTDGHIIAPRILLSSYYNAQNASLTYEEAVKRAATYQEAGYPAGRWRLPTEAEIMFMVARQQEGVLPEVWANGSNYWVADGRYVHINTSAGSTVEFHPNSATDKRVNRFVYDLWYWGDDPMDDDEQYWPNGHLASPNETTGTSFPPIN